MNINRRILALIVLPAFVFKVAFPQSLPAPEVVDPRRAGGKEKSDEKGDDPLYPRCPCFERSSLPKYQQQVISNNATLVDKSCTDDEGDTASLIIKNTHPPPGADPKKFLQGWTVLAIPEGEKGYCKEKQSKARGPFPMSNISTCQMFIRDACTLLQRAMCPCYKQDNILQLKKEIESDPTFILDTEKSCKDPTENDGLPYGIYKKDILINLAQKSQNDPKHIYTARERESYSSLMVDDELELGIGTEKNGTPVCYGGSDIATPGLDFLQTKHCRSLMGDLCDSLELRADADGKTEPDLSNDDKNYRKNGKQGKSCEFLTRNPKRRNNNCKKLDTTTGKLVFEHCPRSCFAGPCTDREDFFFNGQKKKGCDWIAKNKKYCADDHVATKCAVACGTECCKDDPDYEFKGRSCSSITSLNPEGLCKQARFANRCKMSCLKCPF